MKIPKKRKIDTASASTNQSANAVPDITIERKEKKERLPGKPQTNPKPKTYNTSLLRGKKEPE